MLEEMFAEDFQALQPEQQQALITDALERGVDVDGLSLPPRGGLQPRGPTGAQQALGLAGKAAGAAKVAGTASGVTSLGSLATAAAPIAGAVAAPLVAKGTVSGVQNALAGEDLSFSEQASLALPTFGTSFLFNPIKDLFGSGKGKDQQARDEVRSSIQQGGLLDQNFNINLADDSKFNLGRDGRTSFESFDGTGEVRAGHEADFSNPLTSQAIGLINPLAEIVAGGDDKLRSDFASQFSNAAVSNATTPEEARANALRFYGDAGLDLETAKNLVTGLHAEGQVTDDELGAFLNGLNQTFSDAPLGAPSVIAEGGNPAMGILSNPVQDAVLISGEGTPLAPVPGINTRPELGTLIGE